MDRKTFAVCSLTALCTGLFVAFASTASLASDPRCQQLEALHRQYIGVSLTPDQQSLKRRLVAWYNANCRTQRASVR
jgi:hypothetical protein